MNRYIIIGSCLNVAVLKCWLIGLLFDRVNHFLHGVHNFFDRGDKFLDGCWVTCVSGFHDVGNESSVLVRGVLDSSGGAVWLHQAVVSLNLVAITLLCLLLVGVLGLKLFTDKKGSSSRENAKTSMGTE